MDSQNMDRRDSKKSNKGGGNKNQPRGSGGGNGGGGGKSSTGAGEKQRSHSQKSGKRYQEIYKPPSLRSSKNRNSNSSSEPQQSSQKGSFDEGFQSGSNQASKKSNSNNPNQGSRPLGNISPQLNGADITNDSAGAYSLFGNGNQQANNGNSSVPSSPLISSRMQNNFNFNLAKRMFNVNAKEFQFLPIQQQQQHQAQQQQQLSNFLSQFEPNLIYNNSPILASSGCYPLKQSKSSGNMNLLLQQAQQQQQAQAVAIQQLQLAMGLNSLQQQQQAANFTGGNSNVANQFNRLSQSKSSGNVPGNGNRPRVRFDDEEMDFDDADDDFLGGQLENYLASLKLNGDLTGLSQAAPGFPVGFPFRQQQQQQQPQKTVPLSPQPVLKSSLQKSRTGFYLNLYGNQSQQQQPLQQQHQMQLGSPTKPMYGFNPNLVHPGANYNTKLSGTSNIGAGNNSQQQHLHPSFSGSSSASAVVKRSRSFGPGNHHAPRVSATTLLHSSTSHGSTSTPHSVYSDFCITKWPRVVQELVTAAVTGVERIPARNWIEMVNGIFEAMLCDYRPKKRDRNMMTTAFGGDSKSVGITTGERATSGVSASSDTNNDKTSTKLSVAAAGGSCASSDDNWRKSQTAELAVARGNNDHLDDNEDDEEEEEDDDTDLTSAAVHIFLYFIQREKDRTVMESLLNTCFASFQRLSTSSQANNSASSASGKSFRTQKSMDQAYKPAIPRQWCNFLRFLSTLYSQVKLIRRQKQSQQQPGHSMDEMSFSLLALLCDSCLATLRSPQSYTAEMMGCLFTVLTSIGRDMESTFPLKMKQLLAAVRDALLGIGPYHQQQQQQHHHHPYNNPNSSSAAGKSSSLSSLSPIVQKTLMQLIELHAANWQLPASAVRYYYSSVSNSKSTSSSTATNGGGGGGGSGSQFHKSNNNNNGVSAATLTHNYISSTTSSHTNTNTAAQRPSSSSSVGSSSNDNDETKDNGSSSADGGSSVTSVEPSSVNSNAHGSMAPASEIEEKANSKETSSESTDKKDEATVQDPPPTE